EVPGPAGRRTPETSFVTTERSTLVAVFPTLTPASGTAASVESVTEPAIDAVARWAYPWLEHKCSTTAAAKKPKLRLLIASPFQYSAARIDRSPKPVFPRGFGLPQRVAFRFWLGSFVHSRAAWPATSCPGQFRRTTFTAGFPHALQPAAMSSRNA